MFISLLKVLQQCSIYVFKFLEIGTVSIMNSTKNNDLKFTLTGYLYNWKMLKSTYTFVF